ncbi:MAG TPA: hypothetical protein VK918_00615 [Pyrinomonadaceae bacterium]|nr:hypothetical protein [Pyrinomonadaceae bacterium]
MGRLRDVEVEAERLREEIQALENSASQTESAIDSLLVTMRSGNRNSPTRSTGGIGRTTMRFEDEFERLPDAHNDSGGLERGRYKNTGSVTYLNPNRGVPTRSTNMEPISHRFSDRTITQACTPLLREAGRPMHVNELYNLLIAGGMEFKGNNPTISVAVSLNRNRRFIKVEPGTFDLAIREAAKRAS